MTLYLNIFRREPAITKFDWPFTPIHRSIGRKFFNLQPGSGPPLKVLTPRLSNLGHGVGFTLKFPGLANQPELYREFLGTSGFSRLTGFLGDSTPPLKPWARAFTKFREGAPYGQKREVPVYNRVSNIEIPGPPKRIFVGAKRGFKGALFTTPGFSPGGLFSTRFPPQGDLVPPYTTSGGEIFLDPPGKGGAPPNFGPRNLSGGPHNISPRGVS